MEISSFETGEVWYAPDYVDNHELPEGERMLVLIQPMSRREVTLAEESVSLVSARKAKINFSKKHNKMRTAALLARVSEITGLTLARRDNDGNVVGKDEITTAKQLIEFADSDLLEDIWDAIRDGSHLSKGTELSLRSGSDSSSTQKAKSGSGVAQSAGALTSPSKTSSDAQEAAQNHPTRSTSTSTPASAAVPGLS